jgi:hypothetical protein
MTEASWSRCQGADCIRLGGVSAGASVEVRPGASVTGAFPPMAGAVVPDGGDRCFVPRFPFVEGTTYTVTIDGAPAAVLERPAAVRPVTTEVLEIRPSATAVPRNFLRLYVSFSAPMSEGHADRHVRLLDEGGEVMAGALLPTEHELWDPERRRLTVLLDPARIKRGLVSHRETGYPLQVGRPFTVVVDSAFPDARGRDLRSGAERRYEVGDDERRPVDPQGWALTVPRNGTTEPLVVDFDRPLDHALLARCLQVRGPGGRPVDGEAQIGPEERSWRVVPEEPWPAGRHQLVVDPVLEDLAGNSVSRVFDRDLFGPEDEARGRSVELGFRPL